MDVTHASDTGRMAAIGEAALVRGYGLAGVEVHTAVDGDGARRAWDALGPHVTIVVLTPAAATALHGAVSPPGRMIAVLAADGEVTS